jgi:hypothetical protein
MPLLFAFQGKFLNIKPQPHINAATMHILTQSPVRAASFCSGAHPGAFAKLAALTGNTTFARPLAGRAPDGFPLNPAPSFAPACQEPGGFKARKLKTRFVPGWHGGVLSARRTRQLYLEQQRPHRHPLLQDPRCWLL